MKLILDGARLRMARLRALMDERELAVALIHDPALVRYFSGMTSDHGWPAALLLTRERATVLAFVAGEQPSVADEQVALAGVRRERPVDHLEELAGAARGRLSLAGAARVGVDAAAAPGWLWRLILERGAVDRVVDLGAALRRLRRRKDPDEVVAIRANVALLEAGYAAAREAIRTGATELDVYHAMGRAIDAAAGTSVPLGGDFAAGPGGGARGGPPTRRVLEDGDSFVIDAFPTTAGYWADMCRTFPVGQPRPELLAAIELACEALEAAERMIRPGVSAASVDRAVRDVLARRADLGGGECFHKIGHGVGMEAHEAPWIAPEGDEVFEEGDVVAVEPGIYGDVLRGGVRIENNYLVVAGGVERLGSFPVR